MKKETLKRVTRPDSAGFVDAMERKVGSHGEPARSGGASTNSSGASDQPDPQVPEKPARRRFMAEFKLQVLREADACTESGQIGEVLRRHGLYSSNLVTWRRERDLGALERLSKKRGRKPQLQNPLSRRVAELERENARLNRRLKQAETIIEVQKKVSEILGIPLKTPEAEGND